MTGEMLDKGLETCVLGNNIERGAGGFRRKATYVVGDVEIESVVASALDANVLGVWPQGLKLVGEVEGYFGLVGPAKNADLEGAAAKAGQILGLNIFEIDKDEVGIHSADTCLVPDFTAIKYP